MQQAPPDRSRRARSGPTGDADAFVWEDVAPIRVKGKSQPVTVFRLMRPRGRSASVRLHEPRYGCRWSAAWRSWPWSWRGWTWRCSVPGEFVGITAEAGMGKSRLVAELVPHRPAPRHRRLRRRMPVVWTNASYLVWQLSARAFRPRPAPAARRANRGADHRARDRGRPLLPRLPLLGAVLNLAIPDNDLTAVRRQAAQDSLESLLVGCLRARAARIRS